MVHLAVTAHTWYMQACFVGACGFAYSARRIAGSIITVENMLTNRLRKTDNFQRTAGCLGRRVSGTVLSQTRRR